MSVNLPFRHWRINSPGGVGAGWEVISVGATAYILQAEDDRRVEPAMPLSAGREYDIAEPSMAPRVARVRAPGGPTSAIVHQPRRLRGITLPRVIRRFSAPCLSLGVGLDLTDLIGMPSGTVSLPFLPSDSPRVRLIATPRASAADLTGFGAILEVGGAFLAGGSIQVVFLGTTPLAGMRAASPSDGLDVRRAVRGEARHAAGFYDRIVDFFISTLAPHGVAAIRGMSLGIGEFGISLCPAIFGAHPVGSQSTTIGYDDQGNLDIGD